MGCYPEILVEPPHPTNNFRWVWSVYDPPSQGEWEGGTAGSKTEAWSKASAARDLICRREHIA